MSIEKTPHPAKPSTDVRPPKPVENTTDATSGEPLAVRARQRKAELEKLLADLPADEQRIRQDIRNALTTVKTLLTGDAKHLAEATAAELSQWLETSKHLDEKAAKARAPVRTKH